MYFSFRQTAAFVQKEVDYSETLMQWTLSNQCPHLSGIFVGTFRTNFPTPPRPPGAGPISASNSMGKARAAKPTVG